MKKHKFARIVLNKPLLQRIKRLAEKRGEDLNQTFEELFSLALHQGFPTPVQGARLPLDSKTDDSQLPSPESADESKRAT